MIHTHNPNGKNGNVNRIHLLSENGKKIRDGISKAPPTGELGHRR